MSEAPRPAAAATRPLDRAIRPPQGPDKPAAPPAEARARAALKQPRTLALGLILGCFAISGALRVADVMREIDPGAASAATQSAAPDATPAEMEAFDGDGTDAASTDQQAADPAAVLEMDVSTTAQDTPETTAALAAAAEALGQIETAQIPGATEERDFAAALRRANTDPVDETEQTAELLEALRRREAELDAYAEMLEDRNKALDAAAQRLEARLRQLDASREQFSALVASVDKSADRDVQHLISVYEKMKPKQAAPLFDSMDPGFAAGFLARMRPTKASAIMANMQTDRAYAVSLRLAGRNVRRDPAAAIRNGGPAPASR